VNVSTLTTNRQNKIRWATAVIIPTVMLFLFFLIRFPSPKASLEESPPLFLEYIDVTEKIPEPVPQTPTRVETTIASKTVSQTPITPIADVEPSPADNSPATVTTSAVKSEPVESGSVVKDSHPVAIRSAEQLDNTSYEPIFNPKPSYPSVAQNLGITGYVDLDLMIDEKGKITNFEIVKSYGHPTFGEETAKVISRWRFPPPRIKGKPVRVIYQYRVHFRLNG